MIIYQFCQIIICKAIFCHGTSLKKKHLATWGLEPASPVSVNRHAMVYTIACHNQKLLHHNFYKLDFFTDSLMLDLVKKCMLLYSWENFIIAIYKVIYLLHFLYVNIFALYINSLSLFLLFYLQSYFFLFR